MLGEVRRVRNSGTILSSGRVKAFVSFTTNKCLGARALPS